MCVMNIVLKGNIDNSHNYNICVKITKLITDKMNIFSLFCNAFLNSVLINT